MTFEKYVETINELAKKDGCLDNSGVYCDAETWRGNYLEGIPPEEAWATEKSYMGDC